MKTFLYTCAALAEAAVLVAMAWQAYASLHGGS